MRSIMLRFIRSTLRFTRVIAIAFSLSLITTLVMTTPTQADIIYVDGDSTAQNPDGESWETAFPF